MTRMANDSEGIKVISAGLYLVYRAHGNIFPSVIILSRQAEQ